MRQIGKARPAPIGASLDDVESNVVESASVPRAVPERDGVHVGQSATTEIVGCLRVLEAQELDGIQLLRGWKTSKETSVSVCPERAAFIPSRRTRPARVPTTVAYEFSAALLPMLQLMLFRRKAASPLPDRMTGFQPPWLAIR